MSGKLVFAIALSWFICQSVKLVIQSMKFHKVNFWVFLEDGGMPSTHSALLVALSAGLFYESGFSALFITAAVFTLLLLADTMKVRRQAGFQSELMAKFIDVREVIRRKLTEGIEHTPEGVFVGGLLGFVVTSVIYLI